MTSHDTVVSLFAAVAAHLRSDQGGVDVILADVASAGLTGELACAGVMTSAECLREVAEARQMSPEALVLVLERSHTEMTLGRGRTGEGRVLAAVGAHLRGDRGQEWLMGLLDCPASVVRVTAAALSWRSRDRGGRPEEAVRAALLGAAARVPVV